MAIQLLPGCEQTQIPFGNDNKEGTIGRANIKLG